LCNSIDQIPGDLREKILVTGSGLVRLMFRGTTKYRKPDDDEFSKIIDQARAAAKEIQDSLPDERPMLCIGIDVLAHCDRSKDCKQVGQFAAVIGSGPSNISLIAKGFPTIEEESYLAISLAENGRAARVVETPAGLASILVCHDVNAYSNRGEKTTTNPDRKCWRSRIQSEVEGAKPGFGLNLVHLIEKPKPFTQAYCSFHERVKVPLIGIGGLAKNLADVGLARMLAKSLCVPNGRPTLDLWEGLPNHCVDS
jgi:hypothetical protein